MIVSNNLRGKIPFWKDLIVRVNSAWLSSTSELDRVLSENKEYSVFLDYPLGRTKPPKPKLKLDDLITAMERHSNIKYFAVSNSEDTDFLWLLRNKVPEWIEIVPKIETIKGVDNLDLIASVTWCKAVMLDKEDLYVDCNADQYEYEKLVELARAKCSALGVKPLELLGVFFG